MALPRSKCVSAWGGLECTVEKNYFLLLLKVRRESLSFCFWFFLMWFVTNVREIQNKEWLPKVPQLGLCFQKHTLEDSFLNAVNQALL